MKSIMDLKEVKKIFGRKLKEMGFLSTSKTSLHFFDKRFYIIFVEIRPIRDYGFQCNVGVKFLWKKSDYISYDYTDGDSAIYGQPYDKLNPMGGIFYDSPTVYEEIEFMLSAAEKKINDYHKLSNLHTMCYALENRDDFMVHANKDYRDRDGDLGIVKMLLNDRERAMYLLQNAAKRNPDIKDLIAYADNDDFFKEQLLKLLNCGRSLIKVKYKANLPEITGVIEEGNTADGSMS